MASTRSALRALKRVNNITVRRANKTTSSLFDRSAVLETKTAIKILSANGLLNSEKIQKQFLHTLNIGKYRYMTRVLLADRVLIIF